MASNEKLGDETFMSADDLRAYMTSCRWRRPKRPCRAMDSRRQGASRTRQVCSSSRSS